MELLKSSRQGWSFNALEKKLGIYYFDTYASVARICTIRLLIALASIHNLIIHQIDVKTAFLNGESDEEIDVKTAFLNGESDEEVYMKQPQGLILPGNETKVDLTKKFLSSRFSMKDMGKADVILGRRIKHEILGVIVIGMVNSSLTGKGFLGDQGKRPDIAFEVGKLSSLPYTRFPLVLEVYTDASWISNTNDNSSTIAGKEAEWLKNLILEILLWSKPIAPISILCDSAATLANAYSQMDNVKSRHLGVRHRMIRELIINEVVSIKFVRSKQNLADHLTKGLARDLVIKSTEGMSLKSNLVVEC
ncbi:zinc finger, CCHC-type containing protein [Tanacetum coccineum]